MADSKTDVRLMTAPCGRDCFNCPLFFAKDNPRMAAMLAAKFNAKAEDMRCDGCRPSEGRCMLLPVLGLKSPCSIYLCSRERKVGFCIECPEFPCGKLHPVADRADTLPHNLKVYNLCMIRKMGLEKWAEGQAKASFKKYFGGNIRLLDDPEL